GRMRGDEPRTSVPATPGGAVGPHRMQDYALGGADRAAAKSEARTGLLHRRQQTSKRATCTMRSETECTWNSSGRHFSPLRLGEAGRSWFDGDRRSGQASRLHHCGPSASSSTICATRQACTSAMLRASLAASSRPERWMYWSVVARLRWPAKLA